MELQILWITIVLIWGQCAIHSKLKDILEELKYQRLENYNIAEGDDANTDSIT